MSSTTPFDCEPTQIWPPPLGRYYDLEPVDAVYLVVPPAVQAFVYGVYTILFCQCMYIFRERQLSGSHKIILTGTIILFLLCTVQCALNLIPQGVFGFSVISALTINMCYITNNLTADILLIYRCHVIWGYRKSILYVPLLLTLGNAGFGAYFGVSSLPFGESSFSELGQAPLIISLAINVCLTILSAGRIWWISRGLRVLGPKVSKKYNTAIALIVESGAMYCVAIIAYLISIKDSTTGFSDVQYIPPKTIAAVLFGILTQIVGIVPTLIVVRIGLGISTEDAQTVILASRIQFDHREDCVIETTTNRHTMMSANNTRYTVISDRVGGGGKVQVV